MSRIKESEKDQARELRTRVDRQKEKSSLPKRSEVHQNKKKKSKAKIKFPLIKLLSLFFILLPIGFYCLNTYFQDRSEKEASNEVVDFSDSAEMVEETVPTTATAGDMKDQEKKDTDKNKEDKLKEKKAAEAKAKKEEKAKEKEKEKEKAKAKAKEKEKQKEKERQQAEAKHEAQGKAEKEAKARQEAKAKAKREAEEKKDSAGASPQSDRENYRIVYHTVQAEETLFRIAMNYYKSQDGIALIQEWNGLKGNDISKGQVLKIPLKK